MPTIDEVRASDPSSFGQLSDEGIVRVLHQTDYPDIPEEEIAKRLGVKPAPPPPPPPSGVMRRYLGDTGVSLMKGGVGLVQGVTGLADLVSGGRAGKALENAGVDLKGADQYWDDLYSPEQKADNAAVAQAAQPQEGDGMLDSYARIAQAVVHHPSVAAQAIIQSAPAMAAGGAVARGLIAGGGLLADAVGYTAPKAVQAASQGVAVGAGNAVPIAGQTAEAIRSDPNNTSGLLTPEQSGAALAAGGAAGLSTMASGGIARAAGLGEAHNLLAGIASSGGPMARAGMVKRLLMGAANEGLVGGLPPGIAQQVATNVGTGRPIDEGVDQQAVLGFFSGALMGAGSQLAGHGGTKTVGDVIREDKQPEVGPLSAAVNAGVEVAAERADAAPPPNVPTEARPADPDTAAMILSLPAEQQEEAHQLFALGNRMDVAPGVRLHAQNRLDAILAPQRLEAEKTTQAETERAATQQQADAEKAATEQQQQAEKAAQEAQDERDSNMEAARQLARKEAPDSAFNDEAEKTLTHVFTGDGYQGGPVDLATHSFTDDDIAALKKAGLADENGEMTPQLYRDWQSERESRLKSQGDEAAQAQKEADAKAAGKPLPTSLPEPSIEAAVQRKADAPSTAPKGEMLPGDIGSSINGGKPFKTMPAALRALAKAGADTHELANVEGGLVVRPKKGEGVGPGEQPSVAGVAPLADELRAGGSADSSGGAGAATGRGDVADGRAAAAPVAPEGADQAVPDAGGEPAAVKPKKPRAPRKPKAAPIEETAADVWTRQTTADRLSTLAAAGKKGLLAETAAGKSWDQLRPGTRDALEKAHAEATRGAQSDGTNEQKPAPAEPAAPAAVRGDSGAVQRRAVTTGLGIAEHIETKGAAHLLGQQVDSPEHLAELAQVYRDPRYETFRVFYTKEGKVVHATGVSSRMPGYADLIPGGSTKAGDFYAHLREGMENSGADGYYLLHNHPSGDPTPSPEDRHLTLLAARNVPGFKGHVVVNSNRYAVIQEHGTPTVHDADFGKDKLLQPSKPLPQLGDPIDSPRALASVGKELQKPGFITAIGVDSTGKVRSISEAPAAILSRNAPYLKALVRKLMRSSGARSISLVGDRAAIESAPVQNALKAGIIRDAVSHGADATEAERGNASLGSADDAFPRSSKLVVNEPLSARLPTSKKLDVDLDDIGVPDLETLAKNPTQLAKAVDAVRADPGMREKGERKVAPAKMAEHLIERMKDNLLWLHDQMPEQIRDRARLWYDGAQRIAEGWSEKWGKTRAQTAGMLAVLSPQKDWFMNTTMAERVGDILHDQTGHAWDKSMSAAAFKFLLGDAGKEDPDAAKNTKAFEYAKGKTLQEVLDSGDKRAIGVWIRAYDEAHHSSGHAVITPEGGFASPKLTATGNEARRAWGEFAAIGKAAAIYLDGSKANISKNLGVEHKVRNFYNNIFNAKDPRFTTIDTHAVAAAQLRPLAGGDKAVVDNFGKTGGDNSTGVNGSYPLYYEAYKRAAAERGILPREMQSITWEAVRGLFQESFKTAANKKAVDAVWSRFSKGELSLDEARSKISEMAGGIRHPDWWHGSDAQQNEVLADKTYSPTRERASSARVTFEVAPDPKDTATKAKWDALPAAEKEETSHRIAWDIAAKAMATTFKSASGTPVVLKGELHQQLGGYGRDTNPSLSIVLDPNTSAAKALAMARVLGYALNQESMMVTSPKPFKGGEEWGAVVIHGVANDPASLYNELRGKFGPNDITGHTTADGSMVILAPKDEAVPLAKKVGAYLGDRHEVSSDTLHVAWPEKGEDGYGLHRAQEAVGDGAEPSVREAADRLRAEASEQLAAATGSRAVDDAAAAGRGDTDGTAGRAAAEPADGPVESGAGPDDLRVAEPEGEYDKWDGRTRAQLVADRVWQIKKQWKNAPDTHVVASMDDPLVPQAVRDHVASRGELFDHDMRTEGFTHEGKTYLVADALHDKADVARVLMHEAIGHAGLRGTYGAALGSILDRLSVLNAGKVRKVASELGLDIDKPSQRRMAAEELLAQLAEQNPQLGWARRGIAAVRDWMRENVPGYKSMHLSDDELVNNYISPVRDFVMNAKTKPEVTAQMRPFMPTHSGEDETPAFSARHDTVMRVAESALGAAANNVQGVKLPANYIVADWTRKAPGRISWWDKTVGSPFNLAKKNPTTFKPVFDHIQAFHNDTGRYAGRHADMAPTLLPQLSRFSDVWKKAPIAEADSKAIQAPIFEGTLLWTRDERGNLVKIEDAKQAAEGMSSFDKAQMLFRSGHISEAELKRWQATPLDVFDGAVENRFDERYLHAGTVFTDDELRQNYKLNDKQIALYHEFRRGTNGSLDDLARSEMLRVVGPDVDPDLRAKLMDMPRKDAAIALRDMLYRKAEESESEGRRDALNATADKVLDIDDRTENLQQRGYAPLSRFGHLTLDVVRPAKGEMDAEERLFFGLYENDHERARAARMFEKSFPDAEIRQGTVSQEEYKMMAGVDPDTIALFGNVLGFDETGDTERDAVFQQWIKNAVSSRSTLQRLVHRKGIAGFSEDAARVLAGFIASNARRTSSNLHMRDIDEAVASIPQGQGELKDAAVRLANYVKSPQEEAHKLRALIFAQELGGSVASAMVNMTQPWMVTMPFLSQFGGVRAAAGHLGRSMLDASTYKKTGTTGDAALDRALDEWKGVVSPQEIHQLRGQAQGKATLRSGDGTTMGNAYATAMNAYGRFSYAWGKVFSFAEEKNRLMTFIAAHRIAIERGELDPGAFAANAVHETQFIYNKGNKPEWARGPVGATLFTFKQFTLNNLELMHRMWNSGAEGKKATLLMLGTILMASGADGLPFTDNVEDIVDGFMQRVMGRNWNSKRKFHEMIQGAMGDDLGRVLEKGMTGAPGMPFDVSTRLGLNKVIPGTGFAVKKKDYSQDFLDALGPVADIGKRALQATGQAVEGDFGAAAKTLQARAVQNFAKGVDALRTGVYHDDKGRAVIPLTAVEAAAKLIGFSPANVARLNEASGEVMQEVELTQIVKSELQAKMAQAIAAGDQDARQAVQDTLRKWNADNAEAKITMNMPAVLKQVRTMRETKDQRLERSTPKGMRASVRSQLEAAR